MAKKAAKVPVEVTMTVFAQMAGCTKSNVKGWIDEGKLTKNVRDVVDDKTTESWRKVGSNTMIHVVNAKADLKSRLKPRQVKNEKLFAFLDINTEELAAMGKDSVDQMTLDQVRTASEKEQLRILTLERQKMEGSQIDLAVVNKNMEACGIAIRNAIMGLTGRVVPLVRNAMTDRDAENIHAKAMEDTLLKIEAELTKDMSA